ncbi:MAG: hypothetical protein WBN89_15960 [Prochlorococcaceae cyanobacterium]
MSSIAIITDDPLGFRSSRYLINRLCTRWEIHGHSISVAGLGECPQADIAILHVDRTCVTHEYLLACKNTKLTLNKGCLDISKRLISQSILSLDDNYDGPVIIKTNNNYGGLPEALDSTEGVLPSELYNDQSSLVNADWSQVRYISEGNYPVLPSKQPVPAEVWQNPCLLVEKFLPEIDSAGLYCMRSCFFFGDQQVHVMVKSHSRVIKGSNVIERTLLSCKSPPAIQAFIKEHDMDFGRLDYAIVGERVVVYDANKTATLSLTSGDEVFGRILLDLSAGILQYV